MIITWFYARGYVRLRKFQLNNYEYMQQLYAYINTLQHAVLQFIGMLHLFDVPSNASRDGTPVDTSSWALWREGLVPRG